VIVDVDGEIGMSTVAIVGVWDPPTGAHLDLFRRLVAYARNTGQTPAVITIDPPPQSLLRDPFLFPQYSDRKYRQAVQEQQGVTVRGLVRFSTEDALSDAESFLHRLRESLPFSELWLGANQSFGRGPEGARHAIASACRNLGVRLNPLPSSYDRPIARTSIEIRAGRIRDLCLAIGRPPVWHAGVKHSLGLYWPPGRYRILESHSPLSGWQGSPRPVALEDATGVSVLRESTAQWIAFVLGPGDRRIGDDEVAPLDDEGLVAPRSLPGSGL
jgi:hypothetical protein